METLINLLGIDLFNALAIVTGVVFIFASVTVPALVRHYREKKTVDKKEEVYEAYERSQLEFQN